MRRALVLCNVAVIVLGPSLAFGRGSTRISASAARGRSRPGLVRARTPLVAVPRFHQTTDFTCGPAALHSVLRFLGRTRARSERYLARAMGTTERDGTEPGALLREARSRGLRAELRESMSIEDLARLTARGAPVIVLYQAWSDRAGRRYQRSYADGHYAVVVGVDQDNVYLQDPWLKGRLGYVPRAEFTRRWHGLDHERPRGRQRTQRLGIAIHPEQPPALEVTRRAFALSR